MRKFVINLNTFTHDEHNGDSFTYGRLLPNKKKYGYIRIKSHPHTNTQLFKVCKSFPFLGCSLLFFFGKDTLQNKQKSMKRKPHILFNNFKISPEYAMKISIFIP